MSWWKRKAPEQASDDSDAYRLAKVAFEAGDINQALTLLMKERDANPQNVAAQLLVGQCFVKADKFPQAFQVYSALVMHPEIRGHADLPRDSIDSLMVEALVGWAIQIEQAGFPPPSLEVFTKVATFYGDPFGGRRTVDIMGLDVGLQRRMSVAELWSDVIKERSS